ncbi:MAG TPA: choice-of-anchor D domain-containing protein [Candidatus Acidoferrales bacterium]|nr:choice-of-anchor D domain-containing protein [Candidatus Acidoferrales bacterium]
MDPRANWTFAFIFAVRRASAIIGVALACLLGGLASTARAQNVTLAPAISTVAGNGSPGYKGDGGIATSAELAIPEGVAVDSAGNIYIADTNNNVVRMVNASTGIISTFAGTGAVGYGGDGGLATSAQLNNPYGLAVDSAGNVYIADANNQRIRKVNASTGDISTVAGNGTEGYSGDSGPATNAELYFPQGVAVDIAGNLYIVDTYNNRIRKVNTSGMISTVAGNGTPGYSGDGDPATSAELDNPAAVAVDSAGNLYIADAVNERIREVNAGTGNINTVAGDGNFGYSGDGGPAIDAELYVPSGVAVDGADNLYIADFGNNRIREVNPSTGIITTVAGNGAKGYSGDGGPATSAELYFPNGVAVDSAGNLYIADSDNNVIRKVATPGIFGPVNVGSSGSLNVFLSINTALTLSSVQTSGDYSVASDSCSLNTALSPDTFCTLQVNFAPTEPGQRWFALQVTDSNSNLYSFGLEGTGVGSALAFTPGIIGTVAGNGTAGYSGDTGPATSAELDFPSGAAVDSAGNLYIVDSDNHRIRKVNASTGIINTVAGDGTAGYSGDSGPAISAELYYPSGVAVDSAGNLYIADTYNNRIRKVNTSGTISTVAGNGTAGYSGDGGAATSAELDGPSDVAVDSAGNLYIADTNYSVIRTVNTNAIISTVAGNGTASYGGDGGPATSAALFTPHGVAVDSAGNLYIADTGNSLIRKVNTSGIINRVAGNFSFVYSGDGGLATSAGLDIPYGVTVDSAGNFYIADTYDNLIRKVNTSGIISTVAGNRTTGYSGDGGPATSAELDGPSDAAVDSAGNLYIADTNNNVIRKVNVTSLALSFSSLNVDQSSVAQSVVVSDVGTAALNFSSIGVSTSNFELATVAGTNCAAGTPLAVGTDCNVGAEFVPQAPGSLSDAITFADDAFNTPQLVGLSGTALALVPDVVDDSQAAATTAITGAGLIVGTVTSVSSNTVPSGEIISESPLAGTAVAAGSAVNLVISTGPAQYLLTTAANPAGGGTVSPATGEQTASAIVPVTAMPNAGYIFSSWTGPVASPNSASTTVTMNAAESVTANFVSALSVSTSSINFGTLYLGQVAGQFVTLTNLGTTAIKISSVGITSPGNALGDYGDITFCPPMIASLPATLPAGKSCKIGVGILATAKIFSPTASTATLAITDTAGFSPQSVALSALVINPQASVSPSSLTFPAQTHDTTGNPVPVTVKSTGNTPLSFTSVTVSNANFKISSNGCTGSFTPPSSCVIEVEFSPGSKGRLTGTLKISDNALSSPQSIPLSGTGE